MQRNNMLSKRFLEINGNLEKASLKINSAKNALLKGDYKAYESNLKKAISATENTALSLRDISIFSLNLLSGNIAGQRVKDYISNEIHHINVQKNNYGFHIKLPCTLPHYEEKSKSYLEAPLNNALKTYFKETGIVKFEKAIFVVVNNVDRHINRQIIRDNDNYDYKQIVNVLAFWMLKDDSYKCCNLMNLSNITDENSTDVYVVSPEKFEEFYSQILKSVF